MTSNFSTTYEFSHVAPIVSVGALGGSGTRLIAKILSDCGIHMGLDLNEPLDNLLYTLLFKRPEIVATSTEQLFDDFTLFANALSGVKSLSTKNRAYLQTLAEIDRPQHPAEWLKIRVSKLFDDQERNHFCRYPWGWKEPNTHILAPQLLEFFPTMKYVHVVRHGLDMAFSDNQNQMFYWANWLLGDIAPLSPARSLQYWCAVQLRMQNLQRQYPDRIYWLNYDSFCRAPEVGIRGLTEFLQLDGRLLPWSTLLAEVDLPPTTGRYTQRDCSQFRADDVAIVRALGFDVLV